MLGMGKSNPGREQVVNDPVKHKERTSHPYVVIGGHRLFISTTDPANEHDVDDEDVWIDPSEA